MAKETIFSVQVFEREAGELTVSTATTARSAVAATVEAMKRADQAAGAAAVAVTRNRATGTITVNVLWAGGDIPEGWVDHLQSPRS